MTAPAEVLLDRAALASRVDALGRSILDAHPGGVVLVGVLKGALLFTADLARAMGRADPEARVVVDFLAISRYAPGSGRVRILRDLDVDVTGCDVVLVEDLVDTGLTLAYLLARLGERSPSSLEVCTLLDRAERRIVPVEADYVGEEIPGDAFVLGYGLHLGEWYRNLPIVVRADREALLADPTAGLALYGASRAADGGRDAMVRAEVERRRP